MTPRIDTRRKELIDQVAKQALSAFKGRNGKIAEVFMRAFYANVPPTDIAQQSADNLYGASPERLYVVDSAGTIAYRGKIGPWGFKVDEWEQAIRQEIGRSGG